MGEIGCDQGEGSRQGGTLGVTRGLTRFRGLYLFVSVEVPPNV